MATSQQAQLELSPPNYNVNIEGRSVVLAPISQEEINERYLDWLNDPGTNQYLEVRHKHQTEEDIHKYINGLRNVSGCELFAVWTRKNRDHVGNIAIVSFNVNNQGTAFYGILIGDPRALMLGLGAEATVLLVEFLFRDPRIRRVQAGVIGKHQKSWQTIETLGFKRERTLRKTTVLSTGEISDQYVYGILREEWDEQKPRLAFLLDHMTIVEREE